MWGGMVLGGGKAYLWAVRQEWLAHPLGIVKEFRMIEPDTISISRKPNRRLLLWAAVIGCAAVLVVAWLGYKWYVDREYRAAIEEADRLDPGWRLAELGAARRYGPDSQAAALQRLAAGQLSP